MLLQEITQSDIDLLNELHWRVENGDEDFYLDEDFYHKMEFVQIALMDGKYPPNVNVNSLDTCVVENGITTTHDFDFKFGSIVDVWVKQKLEQREKEAEKSFFVKLFKFIDDNDVKLPDIFGYKNQDQIISALCNPESEKDKCFKTAVFWFLELNCQSFAEIVDNESDDLKIEVKSKEILDKANPINDFDPSKLPDVLYDFIDEKSKETQANPIMVTQSALCAISAIIGKRACLPDYFSCLYPNIWAITISPSGSFKTTALNKGAQLALEARKSVMTKIKQKKKNFSKITKPNKKQIKKHESEIALLQKQNPILPIRSSAEGLMELLKDDEETGMEHKGGMIMASELAEFLQSLERTHNLGYKQLLTNIYDVPDVWDYVTKTQGSIVVNRPYVTINAVSTMAWVQENIKANDISSGFFARFLLFYPPQCFEIPPALPTNAQRKADFNRLLIALNKCKGNRRYRLSEAGGEVFNEIHRKMYLDLKQQPEKTKEILGPYLKRWSPYILKIAMLLQSVSQPNSETILPGSILGALSIVEYAMKSTVYLFKNDLGESEQQRKQRKVLEYIAKKNGCVSRAKLLSSRVLDGGAGEYDYVLNTLEDAGEIDVDKSKFKQSDWVYKLSID